MSDQDLDLEERLRRHYHHLGVHGRPESSGGRLVQPLALAACLLLLVVGGGYLAYSQRGSGQPLQTDVGAEVPAEGDIDGGTQDSVLTVEDSPEDELGTDDSEAGEGDSTDELIEDDSISDPAGGDQPQVETGPVDVPVDGERSEAYGIWEPSSHDTCSKEIHDRYWVYGPDGKMYPSYHPPVDPETGCTFGHEHGRDPAGSDLSDIGFPFGYIDELALGQNVISEPSTHVGHKIEWHNDGGYYDKGNPVTNHDQVCDVAYKFHTDTHSADAFTNNLHEFFLYARCDTGAALVYRSLHPFGASGQFNMHCDRRDGPLVEVAAPINQFDIGTRELPSSDCFEEQVLVAEGETSNWQPFDERWKLLFVDDSQDFGRFFIQLHLYTDLPSRYWDGTTLARTIDLCYRSGDRQVRNDQYCEPLREANPDGRVAWDDPTSPFNGARRSILMADIRLENRAGQTDWYTDIYGGGWSTEPFPGSVQQFVGMTPIRALASHRPSPVRRISFDGDPGLHAPN